MKIVIDVSNDDYKFIKDLQSLIIGGRGNCKTIQKNVINAIRNGTPIEDGRPTLVYRGQVLYLTQDHIDALLAFEKDRMTKEAIDDFMKRFQETINEGYEE